jgi:hypothetical protein
VSFLFADASTAATYIFTTLHLPPPQHVLCVRMHAIDPKKPRVKGLISPMAFYLMGGHELGLTSGPYMMCHLPEVLLHH